MTKGELTRESGRIMIIVPHQDDEVLMTAGILQQAKAFGLPVRVLMATNGDYGCRDFTTGQARLRETLSGLSLVLPNQNHVVFLGYADTGMPKQDSFLTHLFLEKDENRVLPSHCTDRTYGLEDQADYHTLRYGTPALYTRRNFLGDLKENIEEFSPDLIVTTCAEDVHGDHSGLFFFVMEVLQMWAGQWNRTGMIQVPELYVGLVHSCAGDDRWPGSETGEPFSCPPDFENQGGLIWDERFVFEVPDVELKKRMLQEHRTALKPDAVKFLNAFIRKEEVFWKIDWQRPEQESNNLEE